MDNMRIAITALLELGVLFLMVPIIAGIGGGLGKLVLGVITLAIMAAIVELLWPKGFSSQ